MPLLRLSQRTPRELLSDSILTLTNLSWSYAKGFHESCKLVRTESSSAAEVCPRRCLDLAQCLDETTRSDESGMATVLKNGAHVVNQALAAISIVSRRGGQMLGGCDSSLKPLAASQLGHGKQSTPVVAFAVVE